MGYKKNTALITSIFISMSVINCASVTNLSFEKADQKIISDMNESMRNRTVFVKNENGDSSSGKFDDIRNGSLFLITERSNLDTLNFNQIQNISYRSKSLGAATYGVVGFLAALYIWKETPGGPGLKIGQGVIHWSISLPIGAGFLGYAVGRTEKYQNKKSK